MNSILFRRIRDIRKGKSQRRQPIAFRGGADRPHYARLGARCLSQPQPPSVTFDKRLGAAVWLSGEQGATSQLSYWPGALSRLCSSSTLKSSASAGGPRLSLIVIHTCSTHGALDTAPHITQLLILFFEFSKQPGSPERPIMTDNAEHDGDRLQAANMVGSGSGT